MGHRYNTYLALIVVILAAVLWVDLPGNPGIHIGSFNKDLSTKLGLDLRGGLRVLLEVDEPATVQVTAQQLNDAKQILTQRSNALGVAENTFSVTGNNRIIAEFPGLTNTSDVISIMKQTGLLTFVPLGSAPLPAGTKITVDVSKLHVPVEQLTPTLPPATPTSTGPMPTLANPTETATPAAGVTPSPTATALPPVYYALMTGADLDSASVTRDTVGDYVIDFTLKEPGKTTFADYTTKHVGDYLAIVLDGSIISAPSVNSAITQGSGQISGNFTYDSANTLAIQLRYGSLPVPLKVVQSQAVGATLGQDSINKSLVAGIVGLSMVILFMILSYRLPGVIASLALACYAATSLALFKFIGVTLTLPGIAGFVLSIGVAVDANILIFERLKEELRAGRGLRQAIDVAWLRAWPSIRDSNITTVISCVILFWFGSSFGATIVQGFATTLFIGVIISLITAVFVTRTFLHEVLDNLKFAEHPRWFRA
jgi:preprotein translocase subunit SecD